MRGVRGSATAGLEVILYLPGLGLSSWGPILSRASTLAFSCPRSLLALMPLLEVSLFLSPEGCCAASLGD